MDYVKYFSFNSQQEFLGNTNRHEPVMHIFETPVTVLQVRIHPTECHDKCALRFELYACQGTLTVTSKGKAKGLSY